MNTGLPDGWLITHAHGQMTACPGHRQPPGYGRDVKVEPMWRAQISIDMGDVDDKYLENVYSRERYHCLFDELSDAEQIDVIASCKVMKTFFIKRN